MIKRIMVFFGIFGESDYGAAHSASKSGPNAPAARLFARPHGCADFQNYRALEVVNLLNFLDSGKIRHYPNADR